MSVDKNKAVLNYIFNCPQIRSNPLFFNFITANDNNNYFLTSSTDTTLNRTFVDGSISKQFNFTLITFKTINDIAVILEEGLTNENVEDISDVQGLIDWISEQEETKNYPDFGEDCVVEKIESTTNTPHFEGVNQDVTPAMAMYSITIRIDYIDYSKTIWS